jgi:hypothetical protein
MKAINRYISEEVLRIFQANYLQQQQFDPEVELGEELTFETTIEEWRNICDLLKPHELSGYFNYFFELNIPVDKWLLILQPQETKCLEDLCKFISENAVKPLIKPVKLFGTDCQSAATFKHLISKFESKGIEVKDIQPSSLVEPFAMKNLGILIEEVNKINPSTLPPVEYKSNFFYNTAGNLFLLGFILLIVSIWVSNLVWPIVISFSSGVIFSWIGSKFKPSKTSFAGITTFRDLVEKIEQNRKSYVRNY